MYSHTHTLNMWKTQKETSNNVDIVISPPLTLKQQISSDLEKIHFLYFSFMMFQMNTLLSEDYYCVLLGSIREIRRISFLINTILTQPLDVL